VKTLWFLNGDANEEGVPFTGPGGIEQAHIDEFQ